MNIAAELRAGLTSTEITAALDTFAHEVADYAKERAPQFGNRPPHREWPEEGSPGDYQESIHVTGHGPLRRRVESDDFKAIWIELGSAHMPEYAVFAKTAAHFGGTGPDFDAGIMHAQGVLREELKRLAETAPEDMAAQQRRVDAARLSRSAAFRAARGRRRGPR